MYLRLLAAASLLAASTLLPADTIKATLSSSLEAGQLTGTLLFDTASAQFVSGTFEGTDWGVPFSFSGAALIDEFEPNPFDPSQGVTFVKIGDPATSSFVGLYFPGTLAGTASGSVLAVCGYIGNCIVDAGYFVSSYLSAPLSPGFDFDYVDRGTVTFNGPAAETPEPSSFVLLGTGLLGVVALMRRRVA